jgi:hypothetical protein
MQLANPIYDSAFKYLMEDLEIAAGLISQIIGEQISSLVFQPRELATELTGYQGVKVFRLDFKATIVTDEGIKKTVLIELQKGKKQEDLLRFRRYLSDHYRRAEVGIGPNGESRREAYPIITIYFLGYKLLEIDTPVLKVARIYQDLSNQRVLTQKSEFIELLSHDSYLIQLRHLKEPYRTDLEQVLKVFDQRFQVIDLPQLLEIPTNEVTGNALRERIASRLRLAATDEEVIAKMELEEEIVEVIEGITRELETWKDQAKEAEAQAKEAQDQTKAAQDQTKAAEAQTKAAEAQAKEARDQAQHAKDQASTLADENEALKRMLAEMNKRLGKDDPE